MMMKLKKNNAEKENDAKGEKGIFLRSEFLVSSLIFILGSISFGCQPNQTILKDAPPPPTPMETVEVKKTSLEQDLREMETAGFDYIFVFRRKDGGNFDKDDRKYLRDNTPMETNRWRESDDGKAYIAGSGFGFTPEQMDALRKRFNIEDFSKPEVKEAANQAVNAESNSTIKNSNKADNSPVKK